MRIFFFCFFKIDYVFLRSQDEPSKELDAFRLTHYTNLKLAILVFVQFNYAIGIEFLKNERKKEMKDSYRLKSMEYTSGLVCFVSM